MNGQEKNGVAQLLEHGSVAPEFTESDGAQVTTKTKAQTLGLFVDAYRLAYGNAQHQQHAAGVVVGGNNNDGKNDDDDAKDGAQSTQPWSSGGTAFGCGSGVLTRVGVGGGTTSPPPPTMVCEELIP